MPHTVHQDVIASVTDIVNGLTKYLKKHNDEIGINEVAHLLLLQGAMYKLYDFNCDQIKAKHLVEDAPRGKSLGEKEDNEQAAILDMLQTIGKEQ